MTRESALGLVLGLAAGVLADSSLIVLFSLLIVFFFPILFVPPMVGVAFGLKLAHSGMLPQPRWPGIILLGLASLTLAALAPYVLSVAELHWRGLDIPVLPNSSILQTQTGPLGSSMAGPSVTRVFETEARGMDVMSFYRKVLEQDGWDMFRSLEDQIWFIKSGRHMFIEFTEQKNKTKIRTTYNLDYVVAPWLVLLATFASAFYVWSRYRGRSLREFKSG